MEFIDAGYVSARNGIVVEVARGQPDGPYEQVIPMFSRPQRTLVPGLIDARIHALRGNIESIEQSFAIRCHNPLRHV
jgi:imidazolonepropionase-like amidohydrolase